MTRALVDAQLEWRDAELSSRLWKDVTDRGMDRGRCFTSNTTLKLITMMKPCKNADAAYLQLVDPRDP